jgi:hypothetical protein
MSNSMPLASRRVHRIAPGAQLGAVVEQAGVEEIGRQAPGLGLELTKAQHAGFHRKAHEFLGQGS